MKKIGVLGIGTMGSGIAQLFAQNDYEVIIWDKYIDKDNPRNSIKPIERSLNRLLEKGKIDETQFNNILNNINVTISYKDLKDCDLIVEAIIEDINIKKDTFKLLDEVCKESTIFASNTSSLSITDMASATTRPDKVIGMHFFNPATVMKLVEVIKGIATSNETYETIMDISRKIGKKPVTVEEAPGFIVNRVLIPMINEAIGIYAEGIASAEDIDKAMKLGANHPMGPLALGDLIGLDICLAIMDILYDEFKDPKYRAHPLLRKMVRGNILGRKTKKGFYEY